MMEEMTDLERLPKSLWDLCLVCRMNRTLEQLSGCVACLNLDVTGMWC
jgi:hypothetical protein